MNQLDYLNQLIEFEVEPRYDFDTFSLGVSLPHDIFDREDQFRATYKIKGTESIKSQLQNELRERFQEKSRKKLSFDEPDLSIYVIVPELGEVKIFAKSKSLTLAGRYFKKLRGLPQRQHLCKNCKGKGCEPCNHKGYLDNSIEAIIAAELVNVTKGNSPKFSWVGSEDPSSLVSGNGRPFFVRISDPKIRSLNGGFFINNCDIEAVIEAVPKTEPQFPIRFLTRAKILVESSDEFDIERLEQLSELNSAVVKFQIKNKLISKRIHSIEVSSVSRYFFEMEMLVEGGFTFKKFVNGNDNTIPNISQIIGTTCTSKIFDILEVILL